MNRGRSGPERAEGKESRMIPGSLLCTIPVLELGLIPSFLFC